MNRMTLPTESSPLATAPVSRRRFLYSTSAIGVLAGLESLVPSYARPRLKDAASHGESARRPAAAERAAIDLTIRETSVRIGSRRATATAINGTVPGPLLRFREGEDVVIRVTNDLKEDTSIHWHGVLVPNGMDGVPQVNFPGIRPRETFTYRFTLRQYGTYWYHSHSGLQEQTGYYGPLVIDPAEPEPFRYDREYVVVLSDWLFDDPYRVLDKLKKQGNYYNFQRRTVGDLFRDAQRRGWRAAFQERLMWARMRMDPTDISDITAPAYTYLMNGLPPASNWTGLFRPGERVRLRFINSGAGSYFDVRIPGLPMTVVQVSGQHVQSVETDEFRIAIAETFDVIVQPTDDRAYTVFAESADRSGYARGTLATSAGMSGPIPRRRPRPVLTMADMGMAMDMPGMDMKGGEMPGMEMRGDTTGMNAAAARDTSGMSSTANMPGHDMAGMSVPPAGMAVPEMLLPDGSIVRPAAPRLPGTLPEAVMHGPDDHGPGNAAVPMTTTSRLHDPGPGLGKDGWRVLVYTDLRSLKRVPDFKAPVREIELHLTGNMERFMWSLNGIKFSDVKEPIHLRLGERVRLTMVNDTMMQHPMHLHGMWMELENGAGRDIPRVHTLNVKPAERISVLLAPDEVGPWAFHCHVLNHMEMGMFRVFQVTGPAMEKAAP